MAERESAAAIIIFTSKLAIAVDFRLETIVLSQSFSICNTSKKRQFSVLYRPKTVLNGTLFFELPISLSEPVITIPSAPLDCKWNFICYSPLFRSWESELFFCWFTGGLYHLYWLPLITSEKLRTFETRGLEKGPVIWLIISTTI